jgi:hypothetical protein
LQALRAKMGFGAPSKRIRIETLALLLAEIGKVGFDAPSKRIRIETANSTAISASFVAI